MPHPAPGWLDRLPRTRLIAEYSMWSADRPPNSAASAASETAAP